MSANSDKITNFSIGDEVTCSFTGCSNSFFIVARIHSADICASRVLIVAHLKGDPKREIKGNTIDGINYGIDSGWFKKIL